MTCQSCELDGGDVVEKSSPCWRISTKVEAMGSVTEAMDTVTEAMDTVTEAMGSVTTNSYQSHGTLAICS